MATHAETAPGFTAARGGRLAPALALTRRAFYDAKIRTLVFAYLFAAYSYIQPAGYRSAYPTLADRLSFAHTFANNSALRRERGAATARGRHRSRRSGAGRSPRATARG